MAEELISHPIAPELIPGWAAVAPTDIRAILARSASEVRYYPSEAKVLSDSARAHLPSSGDKHADRIAVNIPGTWIFTPADSADAVLGG